MEFIKTGSEPFEFHYPGRTDMPQVGIPERPLIEQEFGLQSYSKGSSVVLCTVYS